MAERSDLHDGTRILVIVAALVIIIGGIHQARSVLTSFLVAAFLAVIGAPQARWLERKGIPSVAAVLLVVLGMSAILVVTGALVGASLDSFSANIPAYQAVLQEQVSLFQAFLLTKGIRITDPFLFEHLNPGAVMTFTASTLAAVGSALCEIVMILLTLTFILLESSSFPGKILAILGEPKQDFFCFTRFTKDINRYLVIKTAISLTAGILLGGWLALLGVDYPVLWGFLAFLLHYVPNVGALIAAIPAVLLALVEFGTGIAMLTAAGYTAVNFILGNVVEPKLLGRKLGLSTLAVFLSLVFWGSLLGLIGVVLSVPFTMTLKFACEHSKNTRWIAVLLGPGSPPEQVLPVSEKESFSTA